ncbi:MAG: hypothetical protein R3E82_00485 [Pseudomonadales bacterium]|nr:hypothetical protein [Pseudomonadales bacterium]
MIRILSLLSIALVTLSGWSQPAEAKKLKMWATGVAVSSAAADLDGNGEPGFHSTLQGSGTIGPVWIDNVGDLASDFSIICEFDPDTSAPVGVELQYVGFSTVIRTIGGDQIYIENNASAPGTLCYNFVHNTSTFEVLGDIVGGTGRFEGASGWIRMSGGGRSLAAIDPFDAKITGELELPPRH